VTRKQSEKKKEGIKRKEGKRLESMIKEMKRKRATEKGRRKKKKGRCAFLKKP